MPSSTYPIKGIPLSSQTLPLRQEITAWEKDQKNKYQVSLFLRALAAVQAKPVEEQLGFFQIAGIHGEPVVDWDGVKNADPGFCSHNLVIFPTWHRPYMLLYEQVLYETMIGLIKNWQIKEDERKIWNDAASQFRLPYWDWARKQTDTGSYGVPNICAYDTWNIEKPGGGQENIANPLVKFSNPKKVAMGDPSMGINAVKDNKDDPNLILPWSKCIGTSRYGIRSDQPVSKWESGVNNSSYSSKAIADPPWYDGHQGSLKSSSLQEAVGRMLSHGYFSSWEPFSSTAHNNPKDTANTHFMSLEYIHNIVHNATGGQYYSPNQKPTVGFYALGLGHMADVPVASFDPIFFLHHCNVDRLCAIWQALNWNLWFDKPQPNDPSPSDALKPFHYDTQNGNWDSDRSRDWRKLNYQYDDLKDMPAGVPPPSAYVAQLQAAMNKLYPSTSSALAGTIYNLEDGKSFDDYIINVVYDRYALNGRSYSILFYIDEPTQPLYLYYDDPHFLGSVYTFSGSIPSTDGGPGCGNCEQQQAAKVLSKAQILLTLPLLRLVTSVRYDIPTLVGRITPSQVATVLQRGLSWRFVALGGQEVDQSRFPNTEVAVLHGRGYHPEGDRITARYAGYKKVAQATSNKPLGYGHQIGPNDLIADD